MVLIVRIAGDVGSMAVQLLKARISIKVIAIVSQDAFGGVGNYSK
jgi:NADPH:quinone reductase-like Zn-dependent oxidoreductase